MTTPDRVEAWGLSRAAWCRVRRPRSVEEVAAVLDEARRDGATVGLRGAGNSYGDAALNDGGLLLDLTAMDRILAWDPATGRATVEPGVTVEALWRRTLPDGWWPAVVPGTMRPTWGGCLAMNVHGKNQWKAGAVAEHVESFDLLLPSGGVVRCAPDENADLFRAVPGSAGLLGVVVSITLRLERVESGLLDVEAIAAPTLAEAFEAFESRLASADYLVGWTDGFDPRGRTLLHAARHLAAGEDDDPTATRRPEAQDLPRRLFGVFPRSLVRHLLAPLVNDTGMRLVNAAKWGAGRASHGARYRQSHAAFHFLLDYVPEWRRAYLPGGLVQIQPFVPRPVARAVFADLLDLCRRRGRPPYLVVLKRHRPAEALIGPYLDGWSLAMDFRVGPDGLAGLRSLAREIDRIVLPAGGRLYLAKDSLADAEAFRAATPPEALEAFRALRRRCDPEGILSTDLSRRLDLV